MMLDDLFDNHLVHEEEKKVNAILESFNSLSKMAEKLGYPIRLTTDAKENLCLYYNCDYPDIILVDKSIC